MALSQEERDALPDDMFAVPGKRQLPFKDETHVRDAWDMVDRTEGLSPSERSTARSRILHRAKELGIDTKNWTVHAVGWQISAMSLAVPETPGHPNKMPFTGILTRIDEPSDRPPEGTKGHRVMIPKAVAEQALASLLGMAVDFRPDLKGHDNQNKIGVITDAHIEGNAIKIAGFAYQKDFPNACASLRAQQEKLGFSYECDAAVEDPKADIWVATYVIFTGAAVLKKDLAAYTTTSLAAQAQEVLSMDPKELQTAIAAGVTEALKPITEKVTALEAKIQAGNAVLDKVRPHAEKLRSCAAAMEAAGIGLHKDRGHVKVLNHMADHMEAEATMGRLPHIYNDHSYFAAAAATATDPEVKKALEGLAASLAGLDTKFKDLETRSFQAAAAPDRKTISPEVRALLEKHNLAAAADKGELTVDQVDKTLAAAGVTGRQAIEMKLKIAASGVLKKEGAAA